MNLFKKKIFWVLLVIATMAFIIIKNNKDLFKFMTDFEKRTESQSEKLLNEEITTEEFGAENDTAFEPVQGTSNETTTLELGTTDKPIKPIEKKDDDIQRLEPSNQTEKTEPQFNYTTPKIICPLETDPLLFVILKLQIIYSGEELKEEIQFRKLDIKGIIQNIIYKSGREELKADIVRNKTKEALGELLKGGSIIDVIFKDFKIEIRKK